MLFNEEFQNETDIKLAVKNLFDGKETELFFSYYSSFLVELILLIKFYERKNQINTSLNLDKIIDRKYLGHIINSIENQDIKSVLLSKYEQLEKQHDMTYNSLVNFSIPILKLDRSCVEKVEFEYK